MILRVHVVMKHPDVLSIVGDGYNVRDGVANREPISPTPLICDSSLPSFMVVLPRWGNAGVSVRMYLSRNNKGTAACRSEFLDNGTYEQKNQAKKILTGSAKSGIRAFMR